MDSTVEHSHTRFRNTGMTEADASDHQLIIFRTFLPKCYQIDYVIKISNRLM